MNKKKYEKLNNDLVDIKVKAFNDVKKALDGENKIMRLCLQIKEQRDQYKAERDTLIDDIAVLKANISRLEQIRDIKDSALKGAEIKIKTLVHENVRLQNDLYTEELNQEETDSVIEKLRKQYTTLTNHIRLKAEINPSVDRYIDLVNYIDRLERD